MPFDPTLKTTKLLGERDALAAALDELGAGRPILVSVDGQLHLLTPRDAVGYSPSRRLIDTPLVPVTPLPASMGAAESLVALGDDEHAVIEIEPSRYAVVDRATLLRRLVDDGRDPPPWAADVGLLLDHIPEGVVVLDNRRHVVRTNEPGQRLLALAGAVYDDGELMALAGHALDALMAESGRGVARDLRVGEPAQRVLSVRTLRSARAGGGGSILILRDVTHVRARQARDAREDRHALLGRMAGGIAHDFNNVLTVAMTHASLLPMVHDREAIEAAGREIVDAAQRAGGLVRQLLAFARREVGEHTVVDIGRLLTEIDGLLRRLAGEGIELAVETSPGLRMVAADPAHIERVVANLVVNARNAMPEGGRLSITTRDLDQAPVLARPGNPAPAAVVLEVADTGVGMDPATVARVFEPYFTTDPAGGSGLGLWNVRDTIDALGGKIEVGSEPGTGTRFTITLPASEVPVAVPVRPRRVGARTAGGSGHILVVEDEPAVGQSVRSVLEVAGYGVDVAESADDAWKLVTAGGAPDLLIVDAVLSAGSGLDLVERLNAHSPTTPVIVMTGHGEFALVLDRPVMATAHLLRKPFTADELLDHVADLVGVASED